jgi:alanyl-tRNA synthetase
MTQRLYYDDAYLTDFQARIIERGCDPCEVYLDRTAFYPTSGGQPFDRGSINGVSVVDVVETDERILHRVAAAINTDDVQCQVDWQRRFDHMQQHSGQHLLSAVFAELLGAQTVSFHLGTDTSTIDLEAGQLSATHLREAEERANELVFANRPLGVAYEDAAEAEGLRGDSKREGTLRIVSIEKLDRSACGGTHVRFTGEIGPILLRKTDKVRKTIRVEFVCGGRAVRRARADFDGLSRCARVYSSSLDDTPDMVAAQQEKLMEAERTRKRLGRDLASFRGKELYRRTERGGNGLRCAVRRESKGPIPDDVRAEAQAFTDEPKAIFIYATDEPALVILAASKDSGIHAGNLLREELQAAGGRGGGNAQLAQGSLPASAVLDEVLEALQAKWR